MSTEQRHYLIRSILRHFMGHCKWVSLFQNLNWYLTSFCLGMASFGTKKEESNLRYNLIEIKGWLLLSHCFMVNLGFLTLLISFQILFQAHKRVIKIIHNFGNFGHITLAWMGIAITLEFSIGVCIIHFNKIIIHDKIFTIAITKIHQLQIMELYKIWKCIMHNRNQNWREKSL